MVDGPLGNDPDSKEKFAADLRMLRIEAGNPTLSRLQGDTGVSRTVLSEAFSGRLLPTARTVAGIVRACGADPAAWVERRDRLAGLGAPVASAAQNGQSDPDADTAGTDADGPGHRAGHRLRRRTAVWLAVGAFVLGSVISGTVAALIVSQLYAAPLAAAQAEAAAAKEETAQIAVETGEDPAATPCVDDAAVATGDTRADNSLLEIVWSDKCQAGWGRITRYDGKYEGNTVTIAIYPETAPDGPDRQEATEHDVQGAYTTLVVRPSPDTLLCAEGSFTVDGTRIDLGDPLCI